MSNISKRRERDPIEALAKERAALAAAQAQAAELQRERGGMLLEADSFDEIWKVDRELAELHQRAKIHEARITAFERAHAVANHERRERERVEAIEKVLTPRVVRCEKLAKELDVALATFCVSWQMLLEEAAAVNQNWPAAIPRPAKWAYYSVGDATNKILAAFETHSRLGVSADRVGLTSRRAGEIGAIVGRAGASFIERLRGMTLPALEPAEPEAAVPAAAEEAA